MEIFYDVGLLVVRGFKIMIRYIVVKIRIIFIKIVRLLDNGFCEIFYICSKIKVRYCDIIVNFL